MGQSYRALALLALAAWGCGSVADRRSDSVMFASGADLQSINPLLTLHPLARQVQRYVLFTTLVRYDSAMQVSPYLARTWEWSPDRTTLTLTISTDLRWHDGPFTTAHDAAWTLAAARDPATGYPRLAELAQLRHSEARDDSTLMLEFTQPQAGMPDVLTDLAVLPRHLLGSVPHGALRRAAFNEQPVGNGPFRFVAHEPNRRWVFERNPDFPASLGGPPALERFIVIVVDEPMTKLAALTSGELDFAGIQPAHAEFVRRNPELAVVTYPLLFSYSIVLNTRRPPFDDLTTRKRLAAAVDRDEIVNGYLFGFGTPSASPMPPSLEGRAAEPPSRPSHSNSSPSDRAKPRWSSCSRPSSPGPGSRYAFASSSCRRSWSGCMAGYMISMPQCSACRAIRSWGTLVRSTSFQDCQRQPLPPILWNGSPNWCRSSFSIMPRGCKG